MNNAMGDVPGEVRLETPSPSDIPLQSGDDATGDEAVRRGRGRPRKSPIDPNAADAGGSQPDPQQESPAAGMPKVRRQTSPEVSAFAARLVKMTDREIAAQIVRNTRKFCDGVRSLAGSALSQDETKGTDARRPTEVPPTV